MRSICRKRVWKQNPFPKKLGAVAGITEGNQVGKTCLLLWLNHRVAKTGHSGAYFPINDKLILPLFDKFFLTQQRVKSHRCSFPGASHILPLPNYSFTSFSEALGVEAKHSHSSELSLKHTLYFLCTKNRIARLWENSTFWASLYSKRTQCRNKEKKHNSECVPIVTTL